MATKPVKEPQKRHVSEARDPVLIDLALQGGGSHGAFTWGVLDRLMDEPWLRIDGISGTSAGAMKRRRAGRRFCGRRARRRIFIDFMRDGNVGAWRVSKRHPSVRGRTAAARGAGD